MFINKNFGILISDDPELLAQYEIQISPTFYCSECGEKINWSSYGYTKYEVLCNECKEYRYYCVRCGTNLQESEIYWGDNHPFCEGCYYNLFAICDKCGREKREEETTYIEEYNQHLCRDCLETYYTICGRCERYIKNEHILYINGDGDYLCKECYLTYTKNCSKCGATFYKESLNEENTCWYCRRGQ